jgi:DNA-binding NtrC family response regulator
MSAKSKSGERFRVLVVDDHASAREAVADVLRQAGYDVATCTNASEALARLTPQSIDVVVTDLQMPGMNGLEFIREIEQRRLAVEVLMITAHASVESAVEAMRHGAFDYLEKPFDVVKLERAVAQACDRRKLRESDANNSTTGIGVEVPDTKYSVQTGRLASSSASNPQSPASSPLPVMIGSSPAMRDLRQRIAQVAATEETVLLCGESGTGKELVAQAIHALSRRADGPLVSLNCPVLSAQLTESELFGHIRGAFTGADADRAGRFELGDGGSILLDEVTEIDLGLQAKLLRVLQERSFERVGSSETIRVDIRVLATTNRDLPADISAGRFREDLYYRLAVLPITLPPLRERPGDVLELAEHFLHQAASRLDRAPYEIESQARELLVQYHWPGNVRELQNVITRACVLNQSDEIRADLIRPWLALPSRPERNACPTPNLTLDEVERRLIEATLERFHGHRAKTAEALGIGIRTLSGKLRSYGYAPRAKDFANAN